MFKISRLRRALGYPIPQAIAGGLDSVEDVLEKRLNQSKN